MGFRLVWRGITTLTVEGDQLAPERLAALSLAEVSRLPILAGNFSAELGDLFSVAESPGQPSDMLTLEGDLRSVQSIGREMSRGTIVVRGDVGPYLGVGMSGGSISVHGSALSWAGAENQGGRIEISGDAGPFLGASLSGSRLGMREGVIVVHGSTGHDVGRRMRRGLIAIGGGVGDYCGNGMIAGSILVFGEAGRYAGLGMKRGTIGLFGSGHVTVLPTFIATGRYRFPFLALYARKLKEWGFPVAREVSSLEWERYNGDLAERGQGELLVAPGSGR
jgi:formylmethanofuran dehydrogenase subunit C